MKDDQLSLTDISFGAWVQARRSSLGLTQAELARRASCSLSAIRKIERDERRPSAELAALLRQHLELPASQHALFVKVARARAPVDRLPPPAGDAQIVASKPLSNLPVPPTPLVGREAELAALERLLNDAQCRLLTLLGPGGIGKTRLAIETAGRYHARFRHNVCFVPLASLSSPAYLVVATADALGLVLQGSSELRHQLLSHLREMRLLLVFDNIEHLLSDAGLLSDILMRAPEVKLLVTSRERLNLQGEWVFEVQGLPVPASGEVERLEDYSAVTLFVHSAQRASTGFALRPGDHQAVIRICQMLEGVPLAIQLAGAWASLLSCGEIASEIERGLDFLESPLRDIPERQRSLRATFDHSWNLLAPQERHALCRLALFQGGFDRKAAERVADASLHLLSALVSKSLMRRVQEERYDLHEIVRQYSRAYLSADPEAELLARDRHSDHYLNTLRDMEPLLKGPQQQGVIQEVAGDIDNVRAAWAWAIQRRKYDALGPALRCAGLFFEIRGWLVEGIERMEQLVVSLRASPGGQEWQKVLGTALAQQGLLQFRQGLHEEARSRFAESLSLLRPLADPALLTDSLIFTGVVAYLSGQMEQSDAFIDEGIACAQAAGDAWYEALGLFNRGYMWALMGRHAEASEQMQAGLALWRSIGDPRFTALGLNFLSTTLIELGQYEEAIGCLQESLALCVRVEDRWGIGTAYRHLGLAALVQGDIAAARANLHKSLALFHELGARWDIVRARIHLGEAAIVAGEDDEARRILIETLSKALEVQAFPLVHYLFIGLARLQIRAGEIGGAMRLLHCVWQHPASTHDAKQSAHMLLADLRRDYPSSKAPDTATDKEAPTPEASFEAIVAELLNQTT